ncbi:MAG: DNA/RNA non-specific endonuclease [Pseudomonadota bacterium]
MAFTRVNSTFEVEKQMFRIGDQARERVQAVRGFISHSATARGYNYALSSVLPGGREYDAKILHTEAGHLIPLELGGADSPCNLVPMYGGVNRGSYRGVEARMGQLIGHGRQSGVLVYCSYNDLAPDPRIPQGMVVYGFSNVADLSDMTTDKATWQQVVGNAKSAPARIPIEGADIKLAHKLGQLKVAFKFQSWKVEDHLGDISHQLPPVDNRPNAWIDWMIYSGRFNDTAREALSKVPASVFTIGAHWEFADAQRQFVVMCNQMTQSGGKKGECWSDDSDDPIQTALTPLGTDDGIQIDHIYPKASGGWNVYSNAAVVSALCNKQKGRS